MRAAPRRLDEAMAQTMTKTAFALMMLAVTTAWFLWPLNAAPAKTPDQAVAGNVTASGNPAQPHTAHFPTGRQRSKQ